jgi:hypothetical protein
VKNQTSGKPELSHVVHVTFFSRETAPTTYHSFVRLIIRGNAVHYTRVHYTRWTRMHELCFTCVKIVG